jgi:hypothetical protein
MQRSDASSARHQPFGVAPHRCSPMPFEPRPAPASGRSTPPRVCKAPRRSFSVRMCDPACIQARDSAADAAQACVWPRLRSVYWLRHGDNSRGRWTTEVVAVASQSASPGLLLIASTNAQAASLPICCPVCHSATVETIADLPVLTLYRCRVCHTAFAIMPPVVDEQPF